MKYVAHVGVKLKDGVTTDDSYEWHYIKTVADIDTLTEEQKTAADADGDNNITSADARLILRAAVGLEDPTLWAEKLYSNI